VELIALRGKVSTFNILDPETRARWARHLRPGDVLLLDCLRPILDVLGLKEATEAGQFLVAFDALLLEARIAEGGIAHHMGHVGERSRGDSRLRDWPDVEWRLVRDKSNDDETDPAAPRYFAAYGRDVDQPEQTPRLRPRDPPAHHHWREPEERQSRGAGDGGRPVRRRQPPMRTRPNREGHPRK
jgi:hypothetical protein